MFHIESMFEDEGDIALFEMKFRDNAGRCGPCEDDYEAKCPYVAMLPEENDNIEGASPLNFKVEYAKIDAEIDEAFRQGLFLAPIEGR